MRFETRTLLCSRRATNDYRTISLQFSHDFGRPLQLPFAPLLVRSVSHLERGSGSARAPGPAPVIHPAVALVNVSGSRTWKEND